MSSRTAYSSTDKRGCQCGFCTILLLVLAGAGVGVAYWLTDGFQKPLPDDSLDQIKEGILNTTGIDLDNLWPSIDHYFEEDPFSDNGTTPLEPDSSSPRWKQYDGNGDAGGLVLLVSNALTSDWYPYFQEAILEWDQGMDGIKYLSLQTETVAADYGCSAENQIDGLMKVCNGDYGDNGWRGLNTAIIYGNEIVSSVAQMNEFYLGSANADWHQYTMCHEIGHGFGLPHTDESFWNRDQGNCMDYTNNPGTNKQPDHVNFDFLEGLYGTFDGSGGGGRRRQLHRDGEDGSTTTTTTTTTPAWVYDAVRTIHQQRYSNEGGDDAHRMRSLRRRTESSTHRFPIGHGYTIVVHELVV